ncbi:UNVERIFIED_CONTAM: hypothetical protein FKN15_019682 [Acipenser sinensis]
MIVKAGGLVVKLNKKLNGLTLCKYAHADWNATTESETGTVLCDNLEDDNCTEVLEYAKRRGHFSKCPKEYKHYCIKGKCRYVVDEQQPACICEKEVTEHAQRRGHFSKCPKEYKHYCIKGKCRYVVDEQQPACMNSVPQTGWYDSSFQGQLVVGHPGRGRSHNTRSHRLNAVGYVSVMDWRIRDCTRYRSGSH